MKQIKNGHEVSECRSDFRNIDTLECRDIKFCDTVSTLKNIDINSMH